MFWSISARCVVAAAGRFDAMAEMFVKEWDVCAGVLIIQEAGGAVMNYDGTSSPVISETAFQNK